MTISTSNENRAVPAVALPAVVPETALETSITTRRTELIAKLAQLKPDTSLEAAETRSRLKAKLSQLGHIIKEGVVDGWANLGAGVTIKLDQWLVESGQS
jgi:hypothetical protein